MSTLLASRLRILGFWIAPWAVALASISCMGGRGETHGDAGSGSDPCLGITCSNHGVCRLDQGHAYCDCDYGYVAFGDECRTTAHSGDGDGDADADGDGDGDSDGGLDGCDRTPLSAAYVRDVYDETGTPRACEQVIIAGESIWSRESDITCLDWPDAWTETTLDAYWGHHPMPRPDTDGIQAAYVDHVHGAECDLLGLRQVVIGRGQMWSRRSSDRLGNDWPEAWQVEDLAEAWGELEVPPEPIDAADGQRTLSAQGATTGSCQRIWSGGSLYCRCNEEGTCLSDRWAPWQGPIRLAELWAEHANPPAFEGMDAAYFHDLRDNAGAVTGFFQALWQGDQLFFRSVELGGTWPLEWHSSTRNDGWGHHVNPPPGCPN